MQQRSFTPGRAALAGLLALLLPGLALAAPPAPVGDPRSPAPPPAVAPDEPIRIGTATALSGPAKALGLNMRAGMLAAIEEANRAGGIHGRRVELIAADDGYEPKRTGPAVRGLIDSDKVVAIVGDVGTPTGVVAMPICRDKGVPFVAPFTGAGSLRPATPDPMVFHFRAGYNEEIGAMVDALLDHAGVRVGQIAFFTQQDAYGDAGFAGGLAALHRRGAPATHRPLHTGYERNTLDVESALADCLSAPDRPRAVIMVGAYAPCAKFIRMARESGFSPLFLNVSFVGAEALARDLGPGKAGDGVIVTEVVPTLDKPTPATAAFAAALAALPKEDAVEPSLGALEGYLAGRMVCLGLRGCEGEPTRAGLSAALSGLGAFDLGVGVPLALRTDDHQACHRVWPSITKDGRVAAFDWKDLSSTGK